MNNLILVLGGDTRQIYLTKNFNLLGYKAEHIINSQNLKEKIKMADTIILPIPASKNGISIFNTFSDDNIYISDLKEFIKNQKIFTCNLMLENKDCTDYTISDSFAIENAVPTAEGAICLAIKNSDITIYKSNCLVIGYGRIGKILANKLLLLGANVTVSARKESDKAYIKALNMNYENTADLNKVINKFDIIFNTVNYPLFNDSFFANCKEDSIFIELASLPGGIIDKTNTYKCKVINAQGLPGKFSPKSAADILTKTILKSLKGEIL